MPYLSGDQMRPDGGVTNKVEVPLSELIQIAVEAWRLERWLMAIADASSSGAVRHVSRRIARFLRDQHLEFRDMTGQPYDPGLAVEVVDVIEEPDGPDGYGLIGETISPMVLWRGTVVSHGQVVTRRRRSTDITADGESEGV